MFQITLSRLAPAAFALGVAMFLSIPPAYAGGGGSGGGGGGGSVETIRVNHCEYAAVSAGYVELLISASSSNSSAVLYAFLPDGTLLGRVFAGGQYGGTVFLTGYIPASITIVSSTGAYVVVPCVPFQP